MKLTKNNVYYGGLKRKLRKLNKTSIDSFNEFINIVAVNKELSNAKLLIGITYTYSKNLNRGIQELEPDFCWSDSLNNREYSNINSPKDQWYQLFFPFSIKVISYTDDFFNPLIASDFNEDSNKIMQAYEYFEYPHILTKFSLIVFDSSTTKFLFPNMNSFITFPSFISYLFYYFLQVGGELYIDLHFICSSLSIFEVNKKEKFEKLKIIIENRNRVNNMKITDETFGQKFIYIYYNTLLHIVQSLKESNNFQQERYIIPEINQYIIQENNIEYLRRNLIGSEIEYFPNEDEIKEEEENVSRRSIYHQQNYPIKKTNYKIGPFIKITKKTVILNIDRFRTIFDAIYKDLIIHKQNRKILQKDLYGLNCLFI
jgi:hypothetical protein